ncbi:hypothetical protein SAMN05444274_102513 [Mariniphaga anaerophila]|uniref:Short chain amide porin n=1 Tax=Mariniphaga anaerophila TaxID=1484053 RepID=A0A1M4WPG3_9BACT|nr:hypothetical protein [Mariniphaga anaerophila]SHE83129.1 hypothetical protein SAMN05444274_102513 [Mariniphaga anaerophila]
MRASQIITFIVLIFFCSVAKGKNNSSLTKNKGIIIKLNEDGSAYSKFSFASQFWFRQTQLNPGSKTASGDPVNAEADLALRRTRFSMFNKLNDNIIFYTQLGFNNLNASNPKSVLFFHDVWAMYDFVPKSFSVGIGLNGWNGISRLTNTSYQKTMTLDNPGFSIPAVNHTDLNIRQLGIFAKGTAGKLNYRFSVAKPMIYNSVPENPEQEKGYEFPSTNLAYKGYFAWHFWEKEYFQTSYVPMTYFGTKKICNVGAGFDIFPDAIAEFDEEGNRTLNDRALFGTDFFMELPFENNQTVSVYAVFYDYDFGKNYLRRSGAMNYWHGGTLAEGAGNNEFKTGTGNILYGTFGYLFPQNLFEKAGRLQLFYAYSHKNFEALPRALSNHDFGANLFVNGHKLKLSVQYSLRPMSDNADGADHLGAFLFQTQIVI